ncbi:polar amino acid transport system substrate-binding protein [Chromobacterium alkanivorans]|uniref:transporter substrate-binding domain-containing protein n=1 Tax=Chromobacterium alkanivorans TaxID=1071719 RepID=UPI0019673F4F|nr:transporter substrate-binding domain-containing protein [Chromobacterium alkanivorans]MCS3804192.1 polar amino acid transport system substrate-binding protein [Chromobacterium alkanivorans]MCS3818588.1 polar amino acid transport system substrate-binding protein [Chromobacterium alkanivorans]MCS3873477.1 polar amino acid transport system substrate-binding protein [Chromobacterium alkanivorans]
MLGLGWKQIWRLAALAALTTQAAAAATTLDMVYGAVASDPYMSGEGDQTPPHPGAVVEMAQAAAKGCRVALKLSRLPGKRLLTEMQHDQHDAAFMFSHNKEREAYFDYPMQGGEPDPRYRLTTLAYSLYALKSAPPAWNGDNLPALGAIGVNAGWSIADDLRAKGARVEAAKDSEMNFRKLQARHIAAYATQNHIGDRYVEEHPQAGVVRLQPPLSRKDYYLVFGKRWHRDNPALARCLWQQIGKLRETLLPALLRQPWYLQP